MNDLVPQNNNEEVETILHSFENDVNRFAIANDNLYHEVRFYGKNVRNFESFNRRFWNAKIDYDQIANNEAMRYDFFNSKQNAILSNINMPFQAIRFWRSGNLYYYRPTPFSNVIEGDRKTIAKEISSRYGNVNIVIVDDLNDALSYNNTEIRIDTTYLSDNSIPVVDEEVFEPNVKDEIYRNFDGSLVRNYLRYSQYLENRFNDFDLKYENDSYAKHFIQRMTTFKDMKFLANRFGKFFKHLNTSNAIVLVGNKDVSESILLNRILKPLFGSQYCITITDEMLENNELEDILKHKLIYHIDHIPESDTNKEKLRELLISTLVDKFIMVENKIIPIYGQVIITIDNAEPFLKDFLSSSDVFFVDSIETIMTNLEEKDKISLHNKIYNSLELLSKELSVLGNTPDGNLGNPTQKEEFLKLLDDMDEELTSLIKSNLLDPFDDNFENLIPLVERFKHTYITGQTGSGKSELLKTLILRDILRGDGSVILLEPHGDLAEDVAKMVKDKTRLVYVDPFLSENKAPTINLFHLPNKSEANIARVTQIILNVLKGINSDESFSGAMEDHLEMGIRILLRKGNSSFQDLFRLYNDARNEDLVEFGKNSPNQLESEFFCDDFESSKATKDAVRRRLKKLLNDPIFSNMMNGDNVIDLENMMNTVGKVIVFNIPKGKMTNTYKYYIRFIVEYIQILALKRADIKESDRVHTNLYIDEAHNFITSSATISEILTESRKYKLFISFAHHAITQIHDTNLRDIMTTMTNVKIIGKNSNKTLEAMNKTLNTKLEDVETLEAGEFYLSAGSNAIIKINNTDKLLNGKEEISDMQWQEHKQYQLENHYRDFESLEGSMNPSEQLNQIIDEFIHAIKTIDIPSFQEVQASPKLYEELIYNFNDESDDASGYISKQDLYQYFNLIYPKYAFTNNKDLLKLLKSKDSFFKQDVNSNKTYNSKKRLLIS